MRTIDETRGDEVELTCDDCFFRRAELCAIPGNTPCPTFRPAVVVQAPRQRPSPLAKAHVPAAA